MSAIFKRDNPKQSGHLVNVSFARRKFRFSDWFAEKFIKTVAFLSIAFVILIFIFVFREAFPVFRMDVQKAASTGVEVQESYSLDEPAEAKSDGYAIIEDSPSEGNNP